MQKAFPGDTVDKNPPANAGNAGFDPWSRRIPHTAEQLNCVPQLLKSAHLEPMLGNKRSYHYEKPVHFNEE